MSERIWIKKFKQWLSIVRKACPAAGGPGGVYCYWIGKSCSYNDCPRRNLEESYLQPVESGVETELEQLRLKVNTLTEQLNDLGVEIEEDMKIEDAAATIPVSFEVSSEPGP